MAVLGEYLSILDLKPSRLTGVFFSRRIQIASGNASCSTVLGSDAYHLARSTTGASYFVAEFAAGVEGWLYLNETMHPLRVHGIAPAKLLAQHDA